jgi:hypothetical protein
MTKRKCNVELLETLYRAGITVDEIAPQVGLRMGASVSTWAVKLGLPLRNVAGKTAERDAAIYAASKRGASKAALAEEYELSPRTVQNVILRAYREEHGQQRAARRPAPPIKPLVVVDVRIKPKAKIKFGFSPAAIKKYEARA